MCSPSIAGPGKWGGEDSSRPTLERINGKKKKAKRNFAAKWKGLN